MKNDKTKIDISKINVNDMSENECNALREHLLNKLRNATIRRDKCKLRNQLRKYCKHYGGLRQRTYVDKSTNQKTIVEKTIKQ